MFLGSRGLPREPQEAQEGSKRAPKGLQSPLKKSSKNGPHFLHFFDNFWDQFGTYSGAKNYSKRGPKMGPKNGPFLGPDQDAPKMLQIQELGAFSSLWHL